MELRIINNNLISGIITFLILAGFFNLLPQEYNFLSMIFISGSVTSLLYFLIFNIYDYFENNPLENFINVNIKNIVDNNRCLVLWGTSASGKTSFIKYIIKKIKDRPFLLIDNKLENYSSSNIIDLIKTTSHLYDFYFLDVDYLKNIDYENIINFCKKEKIGICVSCYSGKDFKHIFHYTHGKLFELCDVHINIKKENNKFIISNLKDRYNNKEIIKVNTKNILDEII